MHLRIFKVLFTFQLKKDFSWDNYEGFEDFYHMPVPKWRMVSWVWQKPEDWTEQEWALFNMWAEQQWDQKEDWASYTDKWTVADWEMFKNWMDTEYKDYTTDHMPLHKDAFIRYEMPLQHPILSHGFLKS